MQVFISWSKKPAQQLALILRDWLPEVIQAIQPWVSSEDISKGERWRKVLSTTLDDMHQGIICVTPDSLAAPWLNFEAGALAKSIDQARVRTVLLGIAPHDVSGPLAEFQHTDIRDEADTYKFIQSLNKPEVTSLDEQRLQRAFDRAWPELVKKVDRLHLEDDAGSDVERGPASLLAEVLERVRSLERKVVAADERLSSWLSAQANTTGEPRGRAGALISEMLDNLTARQAVRTVSRQNATVGDIVNHPTHGIGVLFSKDPDSLTVKFVKDGIVKIPFDDPHIYFTQLAANE